MIILFSGLSIFDYPFLYSLTCMYVSLDHKEEVNVRYMATNIKQIDQDE